MSIKNSVEAVQTIAKCANRENGSEFNDATVMELARFFQGTKYSIPVNSSVVGGMVMSSYHVGKRGGDDERIQFNTDARMLVDSKVIGSAFVVPMIPLEAGPSVAFPRATDPPTKETWKRLDLTAAGPQVVLTSQLTGCTFAIGTIGNDVYMGHAQPKGGISGKELAEKLSNGPIFDGLPGQLQSKFLIQPGDKSKSGSSLDYGGMANILGLVVGNKVSFIVATMSSDGTEIKKVMLVVSSGSKWEIKEVSAGKAHGMKQAVSNLFLKSK